MEQVEHFTRRRSGGTALGWTAFVIVVMLAVAALIAGTIRGSLFSPSPASSSLPSLSGAPSPAPTPLPKPGPTPPRTERAD